MGTKYHENGVTSPAQSKPNAGGINRHSETHRGDEGIVPVATYAVVPGLICAACVALAGAMGLFYLMVQGAQAVFAWFN